MRVHSGNAWCHLQHLLLLQSHRKCANNATHFDIPLWRLNFLYVVLCNGVVCASLTGFVAGVLFRRFPDTLICCKLIYSDLHCRPDGCCFMTIVIILRLEIWQVQSVNGLVYSDIRAPTLQCCVHNVQWSAASIRGAGASPLVASALSAKMKSSLFCSSFHKKMTFRATCLFTFFLCITGLSKVCGLSTVFTHAIQL